MRLLNQSASLGGSPGTGYLVFPVIEVTFHDVKQHRGMNQPPSRKPQAVERTAPTGLWLYSFVVLWHEFVREQPAPPLRTSTGKQAVPRWPTCSGRFVETVSNKPSKPIS